MDDQTGENFTGGMDSPLMNETVFEHTLDDLEMFCREQEARSRNVMLITGRMHPENVTPACVLSIIDMTEKLHSFTKSVNSMFRCEAATLRAMRAELIARIEHQNATTKPRGMWNTPVELNGITLFLIAFMFACGVGIGHMIGTLPK